MADSSVPGWEDLGGYVLEDADEADLLARQIECTFIWTNKSGHPLGAIVNFIYRNGRIWLTATSARPRVAAVRADPRTSVAITSKGSGITQRRSLSYKGLCVVHDDQETKDWFLPEFSAAMRPGQPERAEEFARLLDSELRVVLEFTPSRTTGYDGAKMWAAAPTAGPPPGDTNGAPTDPPA